LGKSKNASALIVLTGEVKRTENESRILRQFWKKGKKPATDEILFEEGNRSVHGGEGKVKTCTLMPP